MEYKVTKWPSDLVIGHLVHQCCNDESRMLITCDLYIKSIAQMHYSDKSFSNYKSPLHSK